MRELINVRQEEVGPGLDQISYDFCDWFLERLFCYQVFKRKVTCDLLNLHHTIMKDKVRRLFGVEE